MSLKDISQKAGVHESTVSRVTTSKYIQTPRGLMNLKDFFTNTVGESINAASAIEIQTVLKGIIADESRDRPLSDEDLVMHLESKGLSVARRTIAKYRTNLGIASSSSRKRHYQIQKQTQRQRNQFLQNENFLV
jgi:RNA polymerase sigma-54 factor